MKSAGRIKELISKSDVRTGSEADQKILGDALEHLAKLRQQKPAPSRPGIWRIIMDSPITRPAAAAMIIIAAAVCIMHFATSIDGTNVVWAQAVQNIEQARSAIFREERIFTCDGQEMPFLNSDTICYYSSEYGEREDMYNKERALLHQMYWLPQQNARIRIIPPLKQYERTELNKIERAYFELPNYQAILEFFKSENARSLGRKTIDGRTTEGFEIAGSDIAEASPIQVDDGMARFWIDVETSLVVAYEAEVRTQDRFATLLSGGRPIVIKITGYEPKWNVEIEPSIFEPNIPSDYTNIGSLKIVSVVHILGRDSDDRQVEMWARINPDTGLMTDFHLHQIDRKMITVSTPGQTHSYDLKTNVVQIKDGPGLESPFRIGNFVEDMHSLAQRIGGRTEQHQAFDSKANRDVIILEMTSQRGNVKAIIDPETKLPIRFDSAKGLSFRQPFEWKDMEIVYDEQLPEGIFEFVVPEGATVTRHTIAARDEFLSAGIIRYACRVYTDSAGKSKAWCNTRITVVDKDMNRYDGGAFDIRNDSSQTWTGEISRSNTDSTKIAVFNEKGNRLETRLVQSKPLSPGRFREYVTLDEPLQPGQKRSFVYWDGYGRPCRKADADDRYTLTMQNSPGSECLESFVLVLPPNVVLRKSTQDHTSREKIGGHDVYVWQEHIPPGRNHKVTVELSKSE